MSKDAALEKRIDELLAKMTLTEKIGQLNQISATIDPETIPEQIKSGKVGSLIMASTYFAGCDEGRLDNIEYYENLQRIAVEQTRLGIPLIFGRDVIHGHHTVFPVPLAMAASFDDDLVQTAYRDIAREAALDHVHWTFTPMLDLSRDPRWGRCIEGPGEDPYLGARMAKAIVTGIQGPNLSAEDCIAACAKHYIGYGASEAGRDYHHTEISEPALHNFYLPAFRAAVKAGVQTVMNSFNEINGQPVAASRYLLTDVLRGELGFDGFVISDWGAIKQLTNHGVAKDEKQCAELALNAGLDMDMVDRCYINCLEQLIAEGKVSTAALDTAVRNVLRVKFRLGLFEHPYAPQYKVDTALHQKHARALAAESMVLLKNENGALPLAKTEQVALAGPMAAMQESHLGAWCLDGDIAEVITIEAGMRQYGGENIVLHHAWLTDRQLINPWQHETYVLCLGESRFSSGENNCLAEIEIPEYQIEFARRAKTEGKKVVAVLCFGRPVALQKLLPFCDAVLYAWHSGSQAGNAVADILYGAVNPGGKLPMSLPRATGQIPIYYNHLRAARDCNSYYGRGRSYHDLPDGPLFPFGFGLSYTTFELTNFKAVQTALPLSELQAGQSFTVTANLKNTGTRRGSETVQLYVKDEIASLVRPLRELKGYQKVYLNPGESKALQFCVGFEELSFFNTARKQVLEPGRFTLYLGNSCLAQNAVQITVTP